MKPSELAQLWIDDYLDLLNMAIRMEDEAWQSELLETMRNMPSHIDETVKTYYVQQLRQRFESIHFEMQRLYLRIQQSQNLQEELSLKKLIWDLKMQRMRIAKQLKAV